MARYRHARFAVPFADETALVMQTETDEPGITDHDALQAQQFVKIDRLPASLADGAVPPLDTLDQVIIRDDMNGKLLRYQVLVA